MARFSAEHEGISEEAGGKLEESHFRGLPPSMEVAKHARVLLIFNKALDYGLMNGSFGTVVGVVYDTREGPRHPRSQHRMPWTIVIDFPQYTGPPFFDEQKYPDRRTWLPLRPETASKEGDKEITRTQYPLWLAWALTPWKTQGMTLEKARVHLGAKASSPGVALVALSRVAHPDDLLLDDDFPSMATIMRQKDHPASSSAWAGRRPGAWTSRGPSGSI